MQNINAKPLTFKSLLLSLGIAFLFLIFIEGMLHIINFKAQSQADVFRLKVCGELLGDYDEGLFWRLKGVKPDFTRGSGENVLKIMCLTDSVSVMYEGKGYPDILQEILRNRFKDKQIIVFNGGVPGYTSFQGLKYFEKELLAYRPDIVIFCYGWNDHWQSGNGLADKSQKVPRFYMKLLSNIRLLGLVNSFIMKNKQDNYSFVGPQESLRVSPEDYRKNLEKFIEICEKNGIKPVLMTAPYLKSNAQWLPLHIKYNSIVSKVAKEKKVPFLDLTEEFKERKDLFIDPQNDMAHYNWEGSKIVAEALSKVYNSGDTYLINSVHVPGI